MNQGQFIVAVEGLKNDKGFYNLSKVPWKSNQMNPTPLHISAPVKAKCNNYVNARTEGKKLQRFLIDFILCFLWIWG